MSAERMDKEKKMENQNESGGTGDPVASGATPVVIASSGATPTGGAASARRRYVIADTAGRIVVTGYVLDDSAAVDPVLSSGRTVFGDGAPDTDYVTPDGKIAARPASPAALVGMTLTSLPVPCEITIDGEAYTCTDTSCDLEFSNAGAYVVTVRAFPYLDKTFSVEASVNEDRA
ncbi:hypothetical protein [Burkholderia gladioli]|uniref:hypothetical protein n=1 Tax=Burkholderia gladioli TaxID=28095 RepID=UPI001641F8AA|nr:hypothetical protein [Burkholderia gladioli]